MKVIVAFADDGECRHVVGVYDSLLVAKRSVARKLVEAQQEWESRQKQFELNDSTYKRPGFTDDLQCASYEVWEVQVG